MITSMAPYLSVVIPSYNEKKNLSRGVLDEVFEYLEKQPFTWEVILSDDGSTDTTVARLNDYASKHKNVTVLKNIHAGKAPTVKAGMLAARGEWRVFTDFDQSTPLSEVEKLLQQAKKGFDIVIGSREIRGFNMLVQLLAVPGIKDTQCGFKLFSADATSLFNNLVVYGSHESRKDAFTGAFDVELLYLAKKYGYKIKEVPILWMHNETDRVSPVKDSLRMLRDIFRVRLTDLMGKYAATPAQAKN